MNAFPAYVPLAGRRVVIVGRGEGAEAKARLFGGSPAEVVRLTAHEGADPAAYAGAVLAFIAVPDEAEALIAAAAARAAGVPANVVDRPALCDFVTPALIDRGEVVIAVGTGGSAPLLASLMRAEIEARTPEGIGALAALLGRMQGELRAAFPDLARRRAFLRAAIAGPAAEAALAGRAEEAEVLLRAGIARAELPPGALRLLDGSGPADLLTLRALRALGEADILVVEHGVSNGRLALARRDALRIDSGALDAAAIAVHLAYGLQMVWLTGPEALEERALQLAAAGVDASVLP